MAYYRIIVWIKQRPDRLFAGIRIVENGTIDLLQGIYYKKAADRYGSNLIDCEVQMLSKTSLAVQKWLEKHRGKVIDMNSKK
jgi:hypothetical protein